MVSTHPPCPAPAPGRNAVAAGARIDRAVDAVLRRIGDLLARATWVGLAMLIPASLSNRVNQIISAEPINATAPRSFS